MINSGDLKIRIDKIKSDSRFPAIDLSKYPNNLELATRINKMVKHPKKFLKLTRLMLYKEYSFKHAFNKYDALQ